MTGVGSLGASFFSLGFAFVFGAGLRGGGMGAPSCFDFLFLDNLLPTVVTLSLNACGVTTSICLHGDKGLDVLWFSAANPVWGGDGGTLTVINSKIGDLALLASSPPLPSCTDLAPEAAEQVNFLSAMPSVGFGDCGGVLVTSSHTGVEVRNGVLARDLGGVDIGPYVWLLLSRSSKVHRS